MTTLYLPHGRIVVPLNRELGSGTEGIVYALGSNKAVKVYYPPRSEVSARKLLELPLKVRSYPTCLPRAVVVPNQVLYFDEDRRMPAGYVMRSVADSFKLSELRRPKFVKRRMITANQVVQLFTSLHKLITQIHKADVVIGDFTDNNVLVDTGMNPHLVDADGMIFGTFYVPAVTRIFIDPLVFDYEKGGLICRHNKESDWYAFAVMLCQSLLYVRPFDGNLFASDGREITPTERLVSRQSVFSPQVQLPRGTNHPRVLPGDLSAFLRAVFEQDLRDPFPGELLSLLRWTDCASCGLHHARHRCPDCGAAGKSKLATAGRRYLTTKPVFSANGKLLAAGQQSKGGKQRLRHLHHRDGLFYREDDRAVLQGPLMSGASYLLQDDTTLVAQGKKLVVLTDGAPQRHIVVDTAGRQPSVAANSSHYFWRSDGWLTRSGDGGADVKMGWTVRNTRFWVGDNLGVALSRSDTETWCMVFDPSDDGLGVRYQLPLGAYSRIGSVDCTFDGRQAWLNMVYLPDGETSETRNLSIVFSPMGIHYLEVPELYALLHAQGVSGHAICNGELFVRDSWHIRVFSQGSQGYKLDRSFALMKESMSGADRLLKTAGGFYIVRRSQIDECS